jgi:general stress protein YciG
MTEEEKTMFSRIMSEYGKKGGTARAKNNSKSKLSDIGKMGAAVRWKH